MMEAALRNVKIEKLRGFLIVHACKIQKRRLHDPRRLRLEMLTIRNKKMKVISNNTAK